jgi:thioredoxin-like negative regulator of GroEL
MAKWNPQSTHTDTAVFSNDPRVRKLVLRHRIRVASAILILAAILIFGTKPAYRWFRKIQIDRNLEDAKTAARIEDWGAARNMARSVLLARPGDFDAYRVWHQALSEMGEPRTYMVAANLFMDPRATREDRMLALGVLARQGPEAVSLSAYASLDESLRNEPDALAALTPLLIRRGETSLVEKVLRESPAASTHPSIRLELLRALSSTPTAERVNEAREIFAKLIEDDASDQALDALLILGETPGGLVPGSPLPRLVEWIETQPAATTLHRLLALHPSIEAVPEASHTIFDTAVHRFLGVDPGTLGTWLIRHGESERAAEILAEPAKSSGSAYIAYLHALLKQQDTAEIAKTLKEVPDSADLVDVELAKAAAARFQRDPTAEINAWNEALNRAAYDQSRNRFLEIGRYAGTLGAANVIDDAWVAAVRIGWGPIPLYRDLQSVFASLASQGRSDDMLAMYRTMLRFEPQNPELINNYYYLALLHGVASPSTVIDALQTLIASHPDQAEFRSALAMAFLMAGKPDQALEQLPFLESSKRVSPLMIRALRGTALVLQGNPSQGKPLLTGINWRLFLRCESLAFRKILTDLEIQNLPLPDMTQIQPDIDPDTVPAWKRAVERLEKERAKDILPPLPAPRIPGTEPAD